MGKIFVLIALARFMSETEGQFGVKALALSCEPERAVMHFSEFGDCEAYHIAPENQLNAVQERPFWTPVHRWWVLDFDAPHSYPLVMYEGSAPVENAVLVHAQNTVPHGTKWYEDPANWSEGQKRLLKIMIDHPAEMETGIGKLGKRVGLGTVAVTAVKEAIQEDRRLLNGLGKKILEGQS